MIDHLVASTCVAALAVVLTLIMPRRLASLRYATLFVAVLRFALPTQWLIRVGGILARHLPHHTLPVEPGAFVARSLTLLSPPIQRAPDFIGITAWCVWAAICALLLAVQFRRMARGIPGVCEPSPAELETLALAAADIGVHRAVSLEIASSDCMPCGSGILRPRIIMPDGLSDILGPHELRAVLAHELAHVRRHDNLVAAIVRVVASVFWFHPLLWWIERRMMAEREIACDQLVLAAGAGRRDYAAGIMKVCRMSFIGHPACAGAAGSNLKRRMDQILSAGATRPLPRLLRALPVMLAAAAAVVPLTTGFLRAQSGAPPAPPTSEANKTYRNGLGFLDEGRYPEAEAAFRKVIAIEPQYARGIAGLAQVYLRRGQTDEAVRMVQEEADRHPGRSDFQDALAETLLRAGRDDAAITEFQRAIDSADKQSKLVPQLYVNIAEALLKKGDTNGAIAELEKARTADPASARIPVNLGMLLEQAGQEDRARLAYQDALKLDPANAIALNNLAYLLAKSGNEVNTALSYAEKARSELPDSREVADTVGYVSIKANRNDDAIAIYRNLLQTASPQSTPPASHLHFYLATALHQKGDRDAARAELALALSSQPSQAELKVINEAVGAW
jgi:beta-lactamase regulating signal transducer with metallopeptidase domain/Flp pilus assembly protein TadD